MREVVETLMCNYQLYWPDVAQRLGLTGDEVRKACIYNEDLMREMAADGILTLDGEHLYISTDGRPFVRCVAAAMDPLMVNTDKKFSKPI